MMKNNRNKKIITYSAGSITLKGFTAFQIIPEILIPIKRSSETIRIILKVANKPDTKNIFNLITPFGVIYLYCLILCCSLFQIKNVYHACFNRFQWDKVVTFGQSIQ